MKAGAAVALLVAYFNLNTAPASAYTALYAFGDSLSDAGNAFIATGGKTPAPPYVDGHFSNGPTWVEDLSRDLGLGTLKPSLAGGTDFAVGGATTAALPGEVLNFEAYAALHSLSQATLNGALFTLDVGANDIINVLPEAVTDLPDAEMAVENAANSAATEVEALHADGARTLLYYEVPNLGLVPDFAGTAEAPFASSLAQLFNTTLLGDLTSIETSADPLKVAVLDTYDLLTDAVGPPPRFGFSNVTDSCIGTPACRTGTDAEQDKFLSWDGLHPTERGHMLAADLAYALVAPEPSTWAMMLLGFAGLGFAGWRVRRIAA
jgi:phospholipase/lecithinase/hemolysin